MNGSKDFSQYLPEILSSLDSPLIAVCQDETIQFVNRSFAKLFAKKPEELVGKQVGEIFSFVETEKKLKIIEEVFRSGERRDEKAKTRNRENEEKYYENSFIPILDENREVVLVLEFWMDVSEFIQVEKNLIASERFSAIGELAAGIAHNFNNSLQVILGNLELVLFDEGISEMTKSQIGVAIKRAKLTALQINKLLSYSECNGIEEDSKVQFDLNSLVEDFVCQIKTLWVDELDSLELSYGETGVVVGNSENIFNVLHIVVNNAIEAMPGHGTLFIETGRVEDKVFVRITDTGIGMDEATAVRVFQPFFTTKGHQLGRGLGMSEAYGIIRNHGGDIAIAKTSLGRGTSVEIFFPLYKKSADKSVTEVIVGDESRRPATILWVEDEDSIINISKRYLEILGHSGHFAGNAEEALEYLKFNKYDLMISDVNMPGISGWDLARLTKDRFGQMKVALVSGYPDPGSMNRLESGVHYFLTKPLSISDIKFLIEEVIQLRK